MAPVTATVVVTWPRLDVNLTELQKRLSPPSVTSFLSGPVHNHLQRRAQERFDTESDASGAAWHPLSQATEEWRESLGYGREHPINVRTGDLMANMVDSVADIVPAGTDPMLLFPGRSVQKGRDGIKIAQAQGTLNQKNGEKSIPRPVIDWDASDLASLMVAAQKFFFAGAK